MKDEAQMAALFYMFLSLCLGFMIGWVFAEQVARRRNAEELVEDLRGQLELACSSEQQLQQIRRVLNDAHRQIVAVSKGLRKPTR